MDVSPIVIRVAKAPFRTTAALNVASLLVVTCSAVAGAQVLVPGTGFTGPTAQPPTVGTPSQPGYTAKVIAAWDVVPYQTITGTFEIGVPAFHMNGVDRVEFSANGGPWLAVSEMALNPRTDVWEYWVVLQAADVADGPIEVRAVAYPKLAGIPRVLSFNYEFNNGPEVFGLNLFANADGSLPDEIRYVSLSGSNSNNGLTPQTPLATILFAAQQIQNAQGGSAGGGTIYLLAGNYSLPNLTGISATNRWLTISAAPGLPADQVKFVSGDGQGLPGGLIHFKNISLGPNIQFGQQGGGLWVDQILVMGQSAANDEAGGTWFASNKPKGIFYTESQFHHLTGPMVKVTLGRNLLLNDIGGDLFREPRTLINIVAMEHAMNGDPATHADFVQWYLPNISDTENFMFYNVSSFDMGEGQGIYDDGSGISKDNLAFVNIIIDRQEDSVANGQWSGSVSTNHFLLWHVVHDNISFKLNTPYLTNLSVRASVWDSSTTYASYASAFNNNHFVNGSPVGANATTGNPMYQNAAGNDYSPAEGSPLLDRISPLLTPADANGVQRTEPASLGAFAPAGNAPPCVADLDSNNVVNVDDLLLVVTSWGICLLCDADITIDGLVNIDDLLEVINNWGPCS
jgi:hypothetical protein